MRYKELLEKSIVEHKFPKIVDLPIDIPLNKKQPQSDITAKTEKLNFLPAQETNALYTPFHSDFGKSFAIHVLLISCFIVSDLFLNIPSEPVAMEVTFGLTSDMGRVVQDVKTPLEGETDATKTKRDLPQLPKHIAPDTAPKQNLPKEEPIVQKENNLVFQEKKKIKTSEQKNILEENKKPTGPKEENKQKISQKEFLVRKEEDLRKVAEKKEQGIHNRDIKKPRGAKHVLSDLPKSPFQTSDALPNAPSSLTPTGSEKGTDVSLYNSYRLYLQNQLRINWNTSEGSSYPKDLTTAVTFTINQFGYLIGTPKIVQASGNSEFDNLVLVSLNNTFPVSNPPPKNIKPPQTFKAIYTAKDVQ